MKNELDPDTIAEIETTYKLEPIRGANKREIDTARQIRARSIAAYEDFLSERRGAFTKRSSTREEIESEIWTDIRDRAANVFAYADAYIIQLQLLLSRSAAVGVVPLSDDQLTDMSNPVAAAAWGEINMQEFRYRLPSVTGNPTGGRAAVEVQRIKMITGIPAHDNRFNAVRARLSGARQKRSLYN